MFSISVFQKIYILRALQRTARIANLNETQKALIYNVFKPDSSDMEYRSWTRKFWMALNPDAGGTTLRFDRFENGKTVLEMVGTVRGRGVLLRWLGVLLRWLSEERGIVTVRATPYGSPDERLDGQQTPVSTQRSKTVKVPRSCVNL